MFSDGLSDGLIKEKAGGLKAEDMNSQMKKVMDPWMTIYGFSLVLHPDLSIGCLKDSQLDSHIGIGVQAKVPESLKTRINPNIKPLPLWFPHRPAAMARTPHLSF